MSEITDRTHFEGVHRRDPNGNAIAMSDEGDHQILLVDAYPGGGLQAQLDRIEAKLDAANSLVVMAPEQERCPIHRLPGGYIAGPRRAGCTCYRFPLTKERPANRWAAFTDDELDVLKRAMADKLENWEHPLYTELATEVLERRKP